MEMSDFLVDELISKVSEGSNWEALNRAAKTSRYCSRPIHLAPASHLLDGDIASAVLGLKPDNYQGLYSKACGSRRHNLCPSCSKIYKGDARQLIGSGLIGGKGISEEVSNHPQIFATLTAPSFGPVHRSISSAGKPERCHPGPRSYCPHGMTLSCTERHRENDEIVGSPLCPECYDYKGAVIWNAMSTKAWQRTTIYLRRELAKLMGISEAELKKLVRISYVKVIEFQRRGLIHLHIVIRADDPENVELKPSISISTDKLELAFRLAVKRVKVPVEFGEEKRVITWGEQIDTRAIEPGSNGPGSTKAVANYLAKYATKSATESAGFEKRFKDAGQIELAKASPHLRKMAQTAWELGQDPNYSSLNLAMWAHDLGHRGHFLTKSRRFSVTFKYLREIRSNWQAAEHMEHQEYQDNDGFFGSEVELIFVGQGWLCAADAYWASKLRADHEEARVLAWEQFMEERELEGMW